MINIVLADDHTIVRNGIKNLLEKEEHIQIAGEAFNGEQVLNMLNKGLNADIVLADVNMPAIGGIELAARLKAIGSRVKVILLTMHDDRRRIAQAFQAGVCAYLFKNISADELVFAIQHVHNGNRYLSAELSMGLLKGLLEQPGLPNDNASNVTFSAREMEILRLMADGFTNKEIADRLFTSKRTVEGHRQAMTNKAGVANTPALIKFAMKNGLLN